MIVKRRLRPTLARRHYLNGEEELVPPEDSGRRTSVCISLRLTRIIGAMLENIPRQWQRVSAVAPVSSPAAALVITQHELSSIIIDIGLIEN